jgi:hypothetical protein
MPGLDLGERGIAIPSARFLQIDRGRDAGDHVLMLDQGPHIQQAKNERGTKLDNFQMRMETTPRRRHWCLQPLKGRQRAKFWGWTGNA